jgi:hypothetical protein
MAVASSSWASVIFQPPASSSGIRIEELLVLGSAGKDQAQMLGSAPFRFDERGGCRAAAVEVLVQERVEVVGRLANCRLRVHTTATALLLCT